MRRARLEGRHIGRNPLELDDEAIRRERCQGQSLRQIARGHRISTATVQRVLRRHTPTTEEQVAWQGGKLVLSIAEMPIKCPVAPLEFLFLADSYFSERGMTGASGVIAWKMVRFSNSL